MSLWIRTQDKEKLVNCNDIAIAYDVDHEGYKIVGYFDKQTEYEKLGYYKTKERALEVLDEIDSVKLSKYLASINWEAFSYSIRESTKTEKKVLLQLMNTYQMPKE